MTEILPIGLDQRLDMMGKGLDMMGKWLVMIGRWVGHNWEMIRQDGKMIGYNWDMIRRQDERWLVKMVDYWTCWGDYGKMMNDETSLYIKKCGNKLNLLINYELKIKW